MSFDPTQPRVLYASVGKCIYCGAARHSDEREELGEEHIVPYCMGGLHVIPSACCQTHERITGQIEEALFGQYGHFYGLRQLGGMPSRGKSRDRSASAKRMRESPLRLGPKDLPVQYFTVTLPPPGILFNRLNFPEGQIALSSFWIGDGNSELIKYAPRARGLVVAKFVRFIAKVCHCYACAEIGADNFNPLLIDIIEGKNELGSSFYYIGGAISDASTNFNYRMSLSTYDISGKTYLSVTFQFLGGTGYPAFQAITGVISEDKIPIVNNIFAGRASGINLSTAKI